MSMNPIDNRPVTYADIEKIQRTLDSVVSRLAAMAGNSK